ncbi:MAG: hypothetical protein AAF317_07945 [Pseudomonadota bacterium]
MTQIALAIRDFAPLDRILPVAYVLVAFGTMQAISIGHRHFADSAGSLRLVGGFTLVAGLLFAALMLLGQSGAWALRLGTIVAFGALITALVLLAATTPQRRFGPLISAVLIAVGTVVLKSAFLWQ